MALLERIATLVRANLNELADRAENPVVMMKQLVLDMENQLMQVKTQLAISIADQHLLERKRGENFGKAEEFTRKAELALEKGRDDLARTALERRLAHEQLGNGFDQQVSDQQTQVENLKSAFSRLETKLGEARAKTDLMIAEDRRARALGKAADAAASKENRMKQLTEKVTRGALVNEARAALLSGGSEEQLERLAKADQIDRMLEELKGRKNNLPRIEASS